MASQAGDGTVGKTIKWQLSYEGLKIKVLGGIL
jgi:hypothetical protein